MTLRILVVTSYYKPAYVYGGPVQSVASLCEGLVHEGIDVEVHTTNANGDARLDISLGRSVDINGVRVWYHHLPRREFNFRSPDLAIAVRQIIGDFDLVHIEGLWNFSFIVASDACKKEDIPYVVASRGQLLPWSLAQKRLKKRLYLELFVRSRLNQASGLFCTDESEAQAAFELGFHIPPIIVPNGLDVRKFDLLPPKMKLRSKLNIPDAAVTLLFVGRLHQKKRPDIVIDVHANLQKSLEVPVHVILAGPDEEGMLASLRRRADACGYGGEVHFTGLLNEEEVLEAYSAADLLLMPSESENFGMVAIEAMAAGLPIVVSEGTAAGKWAEEYGAGIISACEVAAFTRNALRILSKEGELRAMGRNGIRLVRTKYERSVVARQVSEQYKLVAKRGVPNLWQYSG